MKSPSFWWEKPGLYSGLLEPFSYAYQKGYKLRCQWASPQKAPVPLLCVGNVVMGGAGKTPFCLALGKLLKEKEISFCFLTRGYGGSLKGPLQVIPSIHTFLDVGDEALLLAACGPTFVAKNRMDAFPLLADYDLIVCDDGFQNPSFAKDLSFLVTDGVYGNHKLFPAGPLREPVEEACGRADLVVHIGKDTELVLKDVPEAAVAFAGIGRPEKFFKSLEQRGCHLVKTYSFPDHHIYSEKDLEKVYDSKTVVVTTEKDYVRLSSPWTERIRPIKAEMTLCYPEKILEFIRDVC